MPEEAASRTERHILVEGVTGNAPAALAYAHPNGLRLVHPAPDAESEGFAVDWPTDEDFGGPVPRLH